MQGSFEVIAGDVAAVCGWLTPAGKLGATRNLEGLLERVAGLSPPPSGASGSHLAGEGFPALLRLPENWPKAIWG